MLTRREAVMAVLASFLGKMPVVGASSARLTVNLDQWTGIEVAHRGQKVWISSAEIMQTLRPPVARNRGVEDHCYRPPEKAFWSLPVLADDGTYRDSY